MPGTPQHSMFKVQVRRIPGVTNEQWRAYIQDAVVHFACFVCQDPCYGAMADMTAESVAVHNFKRRPVLGFMVVDQSGLRPEYPKYFRTRQEADEEATWACKAGLVARVRALVEDKRRGHGQ